jgi:hypothetical protein
MTKIMGNRILLTYGLHVKPCGYNQGRIQINSGYRCATASQRVTLTWSSVNGLMNGESHTFFEKYQKEQQKERQHRWKHSLHKSQCPRNHERAKTR